MKPQEKQSAIGFSLRKISLDQFAVLADSCGAEQEIGFSVTLGYGVNFERKMFRVTVKVVFNQEQASLFLIEASSEFLIEPGAWESFVDPARGGIVFPRGFIAHLAALAVGSVRGMLHVKTQSTPFNHLPLPTVNVAEMVEEDISFDFPAEGEGIVSA